MIITCNNCDTNFRVADDAIGEKGRFVRCSKCGYEWLAKVADAVETVNIAEIEQTDKEVVNNTIPNTKNTNYNKNVVTEFKTKSNVWLYFTILFITLSFLMSVIYMSQIIAAIPVVETLYEKIGLYDNKGLVFDNIKAVKSNNTVIIEVDVRNPTFKSKKINQMRAIFYDKDMKKLEDVIIRKRAPIATHNVLSFRKRIEVIHSEAFYISLEIIGYWDINLINNVIAKRLIKIDDSAITQQNNFNDAVEST